MQACLELEDLWGCVKGEASYTTDTKKVTRARSRIILSVDTSIFTYIHETKTAKEAWDTLKKTFEDSGLTRKVGLLRELVTTRLENCKSIEEYVNRIILTAHKLNELDFEVRDEWIGTLLLAGLPDEYKPMIMALENSGIPITGDAIKVKLLQNIRCENARSSDSDAALYTKKDAKAKNSFVKRAKCFICGKTGHLAKNCYHNKTKSAETSDKTKAPAKNKNDKALIVKQCTDSIATDWYVDSCASSHMTNRREVLSDVKIKKDRNITTACNSDLQTEAVGNINLTVSVDGISSQVEARDVLYVPNITTNLLSVGKMVSKGNTVTFSSNGCRITSADGELLATATEVEGIYKLDQARERVYLSDESDENHELWHRRLGHANRKSMQTLANNPQFGVSFKKVNMEPCETCLKGKQTRLPFQISRSRSKDVLELVHSDVCGPMEVDSFGGSRYILTFVDDYSKKVFAYFLSSKDQVTNAFNEFKAIVENQTNKRIKTIRTDNGREYINHKLQKILKDCGIKHQLTTPYAPEQNGTAERMNRTIQEKARCMLIDATLDKKYWAEATSTAVYLINRCPSKAINNRIPEEVWSGRPINLKHLRSFGCDAMLHIPKEKRRKWDEKSNKMIFVGYSEITKGYKLMDPIHHTVKIGRDVIFLEKRTKKASARHLNIIVPDTSTANEDQEDSEDENNDTITNEDKADVTMYESALSDEDEKSEDPKNETPEQLRRSSRLRKPKIDKDFVYMSIEDNTTTPQDAQEALTSNEHEKWKRAMEEERASLKKNKTWELVNQPANKKILKTRWVFKKKYNDHDNSIEYKARLVVKGCAQIAGIDYEETYSPVVKYSTIRYLLALAARDDLDIDHMDVKTAYLQSDIEEETYVYPPEELGAVKGKVWKLHKAMYGLKQSGRSWNKRLDAVLKTMDFQRSQTDQCVYWKRKSKGLVIIAVYVDDLLVLSNNKKLKEITKETLKTYFHMKDLGEVKKCVGMTIERNRNEGKIWISQTDYIKTIIEKFNMQDSKPVSTPMDANTKLNTLKSTKEEQEKELEIPYQEAIGSLIYASQISRPDISFAVNALSSFNRNPSKAHWSAVKRIFRYLRGTTNYKLEYNKSGNRSIECYSDADWGNRSDRRSITGSCFKLQGGLISWFSKCQKTVALSTTEAEYMAVSFSCQEALWLKQLSEELDPCPNKKTITLYCDNKSAICLTKNSIINQRSKHIDIKYHFFQEHLSKGNIEVEFTPTEEMIADALTKPLFAQKHLFCVKGMGITGT